MKLYSVHANGFPLQVGGLVLLMAVLVISGGVAYAGLEGAGESLKHMDAAVVTIEDAAKHASQGHGDQVSSHSSQAITHAEQAIKAMPTGNAHARESLTLLKEAVENLNKATQFANEGNTRKATNHVNLALDFVDAAILHLRHSH